MIVQEIWDQFLHIAKEEAGSRVVETWFKAVSLIKWDPAKRIAYLQAPNKFVKDWITRNYLELIQLHLGRLLHTTGVTVSFATESVHNKKKEKSETIVPATTIPSRSVPIKNSLVHANGHINRSYSFDTFVVGPNNSLAYAAAQAVTERPGRVYNPLFLYGGSGLGKTHLMHAMGNEIKGRHKKASVLYQTADRFVNEFISAIRFDKIHKFQAKYKNVDVLLIDDIQFISNKDQTQEAFFHIFNTLYEGYKQIVFSSDTFPQNIEGIADRLKSRLAWGLVADLRVPTLETKIAILKKKAYIGNEPLSDEVAHFIANRVMANIRELEGALIRVMAFASLTQQKVTLELAEKVLADNRKKNNGYLDSNTVLKGLLKCYPYTLDQLKSKQRNKEISFVRQATMFLLKELAGKSLRDIGELLGGRNHATVLYAIDKIEQLIETDAEVRKRIKYIEREIHKITSSVS